MLGLPDENQIISSVILVVIKLLGNSSKLQIVLGPDRVLASSAEQELFKVYSIFVVLSRMFL